jgi:hypothetical protein
VLFVFPRFISCPVSSLPCTSFTAFLLSCQVSPDQSLWYSSYSRLLGHSTFSSFPPSTSSLLFPSFHHMPHLAAAPTCVGLTMTPWQTCRPPQSRSEWVLKVVGAIHLTGQSVHEAHCVTFRPTRAAQPVCPCHTSLPWKSLLYACPFVYLSLYVYLSVNLSLCVSVPRLFVLDLTLTCSRPSPACHHLRIAPEPAARLRCSCLVPSLSFTLLLSRPISVMYHVFTTAMAIHCWFISLVASCYQVRLGVALLNKDIVRSTLHKSGDYSGQGAVPMSAPTLADQRAAP